MTLKKMMLLTKLTLIAIAFICAIIVTSFVARHSSKNLTNSIESEHKYLINSLSGYLEHFNDTNILYIDTFLEHSKIAKNIQTMTREQFYQQTLPFYAKYKSSNEFLWGMHIILKDGMSLIRMHSPSTPDNKVSQNKALIQSALKSQKMQTGFEVGKYGYFYRIVYPIFLHNEFLGVCEFSYKVNHIISDIHKHFDVSMVFAFKEDSSSKKLIDYTHKSLDNYIIQHATEPILYDYMTTLSVAKNHFSIFKQKDKIFSLYTYKLPDMQNRSKIISFHEVTQAYDNRETLLYQLFFLLTSLVLFITFCIHILINYLMKNIQEKEAQTQEKGNKLYFNLRHNNLTKLPNMNILNEDMSHFKNYTIVMLSIDNLSILNTTYGEEIVDVILIKSATLLKKTIPKNALLYHINPDEFTVIINEPHRDQALSLASQIKSYFEQTPIYVENLLTHISFTIGIAEHNKHKLNPFSQANIALIEAKHSGKSLILMYNDSMSRLGSYSQLAKNIAILQNDLEEEKLTPFYQAIVNTQTKEIFKYEVLARIKNESGKFITPFHFMEAAKVSGLQTAITKQMIQKSFIYFSSTDVQFSINITKQDFLEKYLVDFLTIKTKRHNINPKNVTLEILEDIAIENNEEIVEQINYLGSLGYVIAIDDFGVESSNMSKLADINADYIKIDGSFIKDITKNPTHLHIVEALVYIANKLGMQIVAEYVHSEEVYQEVKKLGIDYSQGYYFHEPAETIDFNEKKNLS